MSRDGGRHDIIDWCVCEFTDENVMQCNASSLSPTSPWVNH